MTELFETSAETSRQATPISAAGRLLAVLDAFGPRNRVLSLSEISRRSGLSLTTTHRLVHELQSWGALERDASGCYSIGIRLLELAALAPRGLGLREAAFPALDDLHHRTRGSVRLGVLDGEQVVYVETIQAYASHQLIGRVGDRWPVHVPLMGLVLLAYADRELQEQVLRHPLERFGPLTVTDPSELRRKLAQVRQTGYAMLVNRASMREAVAAPVWDPGGNLAAAVSLAVDADQFRPQVLASMLLDASAEITRRMASQSE